VTWSWRGVLADAYLGGGIRDRKFLKHLVSDETGEVLCGKVSPDSITDGGYRPEHEKPCPRCVSRARARRLLTA
jgi:hypothetical protein